MLQGWFGCAERRRNDNGLNHAIITEFGRIGNSSAFFFRAGAVFIGL